MTSSFVNPDRPPNAWARMSQLLLRLIFVATSTLVLVSCASGPREYTRTVTTAPENTSDTFLSRAALRAGDTQDGRSGVNLVVDGPEALALRLALAESAERTIDAQYYLLHDDEAGHLYAWSLVQAAERGVRVRLLLDDMDVGAYDTMSAALDMHPNIEIRLFNPFRRGLGSNIASLLELGRVTRRMHNKSMTADGVFTLVGGRNIGNEYFAAREDINYNDLDVLAAGPIARDVSRMFDAYWNSQYSVPARAVVRESQQDLTLQEAIARLEVLARTAADGSYAQAVAHDIRGRFAQSRLELAWVPATLVADPPEKAAGDAETESLVAAQIMPYLDAAEDSVYISSAYFVPRQRGVEFFEQMIRRGVDVNILTNSLDSTDVLPVHGHYARMRTDLLEAGVSLYELRPDAQRHDRERLGLNLSQSSLHTKAFILDERYFFIGSFNWDPRSVWLNNEMGVLIDSPDLSRHALRLFRDNLPSNAYELRLDEAGGIDWWMYREEDGVSVLYPNEPTSSRWRSIMSSFYSIVPFGRQL